ncbi:vesicle-associated protein 2-2-like [Humulus lupulus]|uniref:vesicle-associated protein 2-2-like n=1 Tax=Humulus lupulus TaxID=3486 RepID=UPI002B41840B|nr:vesicle-associated protein 2-2-like [Humulus lupulus]
MSKLLEIQPKELKFTIELKKPSSCSVRLANNTNYHVAFKVKTTSPKRYCVRPNVGVVMPNSSSDFIVTMQMPRTTPLDLDCKDKFLIQSTVVSAETTDEDITASMFVKDSGKLVEEKKLRVILISPTHSPTLSPINGALNQGMGHDYLIFKDQSLNGVENLSKQHTVSKDTEESVTVKIKEPKPVEATELKPVKNVEFMLEKDVQELKPAKGVEELKPAKHVEELKPVKYTEELKPVEYTEELKPAMYEEELKPAMYAEELKPSVYTEELKASMFAEELKPARYVEELKPSMCTEDLKSAKYVEDLKPSKYVEEVNPAKDVKYLNSDKDVEELKPAKDIELKSVGSVAELKPVRDVEMKNVKAVEELKLFKDVEEIKSKLSQFELKLHQADVAILKLMEERKSSIEERNFLQEKLAELSKGGVKTVQVGFPLLFVLMVAFISIVLGYRLHP